MLSDGETIVTPLLQRRILRGCMLLCLLGAPGCGDPPSSPPEPFTGSVRIAAMDTVQFDSIAVGLDDVVLGRMRNPCVVSGILAGTHKITLLDTSGARADTMFTIRRDMIASLMLHLTRIGPFPGNEAPNFTARDLDQRNMELASLRGKVVFLIFFEYT